MMGGVINFRRPDLGEEEYVDKVYKYDPGKGGTLCQK